MKKLFSDTGYLGAANVVSTVTELGLQIFIVRATAPAIFGEYAVALAIATLLESVIVARSGEIALHYVGKAWIAKNYTEARVWANRIVKNDQLVYGGLYLLIILLAIALAPFIKIDMLYLVGLALMIPCQIGYGVYKSLFITTERLKHQALFELSFVLTKAAMGILGLVLFGIPGLISGLVLSTLAKNVLARSLTAGWWPPLGDEAWRPRAVTGSTEEDEAVSWLKMSSYSILRNIFISTSRQIDLPLLAALQGYEAVAIYKVAKTLAALPARMVQPLWSALRPRMMTAWYEGDKTRIMRLIAIPSLLILGAFILAVGPIIMFSDNLIQNLYGAAYLEVVWPLLFLLTGHWIFSAMTSSWFNFWIIISAKRLTGVMVYGVLFVLILSSVLYYGRLSVFHTSAAVSASMIVTSILCWAVFLRSIKNLNAV